MAQQHVNMDAFGIGSRRLNFELDTIVALLTLYRTVFDEFSEGRCVVARPEAFTVWDQNGNKLDFEWLRFGPQNNWHIAFTTRDGFTKAVLCTKERGVEKPPHNIVEPVYALLPRFLEKLFKFRPDGAEKLEPFYAAAKRAA